MAEHIWSVLALKTIVDKDTNTLSLMDVLETITVSGEGPAKYKKGEKVNIYLASVLTTFWTRSDKKKPESSEYRVSIYDPDKKKIGSNMIKLDLSKTLRVRSQLGFKVFPMRGFGSYEYKVEMKVKKGKKETWKKVALLPVEVVYNPNLDG